jgi:hypothetical protein
MDTQSLNIVYCKKNEKEYDYNFKEYFLNIWTPSMKLFIFIGLSSYKRTFTSP